MVGVLKIGCKIREQWIFEYFMSENSIEKRAKRQKPKNPLKTRKSQNMFSEICRNEIYSIPQAEKGYV